MFKLQFSFYLKNLCFDRTLMCFVGLYRARSYLVLVASNKTNIPGLFLFNIEIIHPREYDIQLRFASFNINYSGE